jgi:uncharacterized protein (TIGR03066 family)
VALLCGSALALADAKPDAKKLFLGKWQPDGEADITLEVMPAGKLQIVITGKEAQTIAGTYKWVDAETVEVTIAMDKDKKTEKLKLAFDGDTMTTTDQGGKADKFKRVKK